jgi:hypothetical protein
MLAIQLAVVRVCALFLLDRERFIRAAVAEVAAATAVVNTVERVEYDRAECVLLADIQRCVAFVKNYYYFKNVLEKQKKSSC